MAQNDYTFDDAAAYDRYMTAWTRAAGTRFIEWAAPPSGARWLDVGCGTGIFTELALDSCAPSAMTAIDAAPLQIEQALAKPVARRARFELANVEDLPFADASFDVVTATLVLNFIADRAKALAQMRRVGWPGAPIAGYVWDLPGERGPNFPMRLALMDIGITPPPVAGTDAARLEAIAELLARAGLAEVATRQIEVSRTFQDFDTFWQVQTPSYTPVSKLILAMSDGERARLRAAVRDRLSVGTDGAISFTARANAFKARVPR